MEDPGQSSWHMAHAAFAAPTRLEWPLCAVDFARYANDQIDQYLFQNGGNIYVCNIMALPYRFVARVMARIEALDMNPYCDSIKFYLSTLARITRAPTYYEETSSEDDSDAEPVHWTQWRETSRSLSARSQMQMLRRREFFHDKLIKYGCQPCYPIQVRERGRHWIPEYEDIFLFWLGQFENSGREGYMNVYELQWQRWQEFKNWQYSTRDVYSDDPSARLEIGLNFMTQYGVLRPIRFVGDPAEQDRLTTWLEYMFWEYTQHETLEWHFRYERWFQHCWESLLNDLEALGQDGLLDFDTDEELEGDITLTRLERNIERARAFVSRSRTADEYIPPSSPGYTITEEKLAEYERMYQAYLEREEFLEMFDEEDFALGEAEERYNRNLLLLEWLMWHVRIVEREVESQRRGFAGHGRHSCTTYYSEGLALLPAPAPAPPEKHDHDGEPSDEEPDAKRPATAASSIDLAAAAAALAHSPASLLLLLTGQPSIGTAFIDQPSTEEPATEQPSTEEASSEEEPANPC